MLLARLKNVIGKENSKGKLIPQLKITIQLEYPKAVNWQVAEILFV